MSTRLVFACFNKYLYQIYIIYKFGFYNLFLQTKRLFVLSENKKEKNTHHKTASIILLMAISYFINGTIMNYKIIFLCKTHHQLIIHIFHLSGSTNKLFHYNKGNLFKIFPIFMKSGFQYH